MPPHLQQIFIFFILRIESKPVQSCSPSQCQPETLKEEDEIIIIKDQAQAQASGTQIREISVPVPGKVDRVQAQLSEIRDKQTQAQASGTQVQEITVPFRGDVERVQAQLSDIREEQNQAQASGTQIQEIPVPFRGDVERVQAQHKKLRDEQVQTDVRDGCKDEVEARTQFEFETICKKYVPRTCDPDEACRAKEVCYKKPRLRLTRSTSTLRCRYKRYES